ncbi:RNA-binding S4 domain-containing protein [Sporolactobacillus sp. Y61]|jgi:ribosomal 50S subunit-recycling heat shock protein|uniref:RQC P-site tRNA stabilizing factor n=1 Tax=Sporolactobacillus sp. Y61 TaxID=3160863 RepID=A0AAU8IHU2_9BACL|nr:RNA-binding S4 domain-containing protein [Sporolactobacillus sp. THM19-2]RYL89830.1 RNA-binding S4 domain-containing protein [Sporolactobacillus sp. THM19-2]
MRLDKFLKISRLIKRRTVAKEMADQGRVDINGRPGKASSDVQTGDVLVLHFGQKKLTIRITLLKETVKKEEAASLYEIIDEKPSA